MFVVTCEVRSSSEAALLYWDRRLNQICYAVGAEGVSREVGAGGDEEDEDEEDGEENDKREVERGTMMQE